MSATDFNLCALWLCWERNVRHWLTILPSDSLGAKLQDIFHCK